MMEASVPAAERALPDTSGEALATLIDYYEDPTRAARGWKAEGGKVVGYMCDSVPRELVAAAGFFPCRLVGDGSVTRDRVARYVDPYMQQPVPSPGFVWSMLEQVLAGAYECIDYLIIPNGRKSIYAFHRYLEEARARHGELVLPECFFLDKSFTPFFGSQQFDRKSFQRLLDALAQWSGATITDESLGDAVTRADEQRRLLREVIRARRSQIPGSQALAILGSSQVMGYEQHNALLEAVLGGVDNAPSVAGCSVFLGGSPVDRPGLYEIIEAAGGNVVAEDHCWGARLADAPLREDTGALEALAQRFCASSFCSMRFPVRETVGTCVARALACEPEAAIFWVLGGDMARAWEAPSEVRALREAGVPCLFLRDQDYALGDRDELERVVGAFLAQVPAAAGGAR